MKKLNLNDLAKDLASQDAQVGYSPREDEVKAVKRTLDRLGVYLRHRSLWERLVAFHAIITSK